MKQGILQADGLCKSYGRKAVLENLSIFICYRNFHSSRSFF